MSGIATKKMLRAYEQVGSPTLFLTGFFKASPGNFYEGETIEIDIERTDEDVAIAVQSLSAGYNVNSADIFTNKEFKAPIFKESFPLNATDLIKRQPGDTPYNDPIYRANLVKQMFKGMAKLEKKVKRALELMSSQVLQTGKLVLTDENGVEVYALDFKPKATHFPTSAIAWTAAGATIVDDLLNLCNVNKTDGLSESNVAIFGEASFEAAMKNEDFRARLDTRRINLGNIGPMVRNTGGGIFRGVIEVGNYQLEVWTYNARYKDPETGDKIKFVASNKVIVMDSMARLDLSFGGIPNIAKILGISRNTLPQILPRRVSLAGNSVDIHLNTWVSEDGEQITAGVGTRPLVIPTAIDTYGCLNTGI